MGETERKASDRLGEHLRSMNNKDTSTSVGKHFQEPGHSTKHCTFIPFQKLDHMIPSYVRRDKKILSTSSVLLKCIQYHGFFYTIAILTFFSVLKHLGAIELILNTNYTPL